MVTNQSAVNRGLTTRASVASIHARMRAEIEQSGGRLDAIYECPTVPTKAVTAENPALYSSGGLRLSGLWILAVHTSSAIAAPTRTLDGT